MSGSFLIRRWSYQAATNYFPKSPVCIFCAKYNIEEEKMKRFSRSLFCNKLSLNDAINYSTAYVPKPNSVHGKEEKVELPADEQVASQDGDEF